MLYVKINSCDLEKKLVCRTDGFVELAARIRKDYEKGATIELVQADGDELERIYSRFKGIPTATYSRVVVWTGDFAAFIALNLE